MIQPQESAVQSVEKEKALKNVAQTPRTLSASSVPSKRTVQPLKKAELVKRARLAALRVSPHPFVRPITTPFVARVPLGGSYSLARLVQTSALSVHPAHLIKKLFTGRNAPS